MPLISQHSAGLPRMEIITRITQMPFIASWYDPCEVVLLPLSFCDSRNGISCDIIRYTTCNSFRFWVFQQTPPNSRRVSLYRVTKPCILIFIGPIKQMLYRIGGGAGSLGACWRWSEFVFVWNAKCWLRFWFDTFGKSVRDLFGEDLLMHQNNNKNNTDLISLEETFMLAMIKLPGME